MKKTIGVERVYLVSNYNTIRLGEELSELPEKLIFNQEFVKKLYDLIFVNMEINYRKYLNLLKDLHGYTDETVMQHLEEIKENTLEDIAIFLLL